MVMRDPLVSRGRGGKNTVLSQSRAEAARSKSQHHILWRCVCKFWLSFGRETRSHGQCATTSEPRPGRVTLKLRDRN